MWRLSARVATSRVLALLGELVIPVRVLALVGRHAPPGGWLGAFAGTAPGRHGNARVIAALDLLGRQATTRLFSDARFGAMTATLSELPSSSSPRARSRSRGGTSPVTAGSSASSWPGAASSLRRLDHVRQLVPQGLPPGRSDCSADTGLARNGYRFPCVQTMAPMAVAGGSSRMRTVKKSVPNACSILACTAAGREPGASAGRPGLFVGRVEGVAVGPGCPAGFGAPCCARVGWR
jgi:hypothetical protein